MGNRAVAGLVGSLFAVAIAGCAAAQSALPPLAVPHPAYTTTVLEMMVDRPAKDVWARVGKFCDVGEWLRNPCTLTTGKEGELGAVRQLKSGVVEMIVARSDHSYTYTQPVRAGVPFNAYHGTLEVQPVTARSARLVYSFFYDTSMMADDAARATDAANRRARFTDALHNMKILAEGGVMPPMPK